MITRRALIRTFLWLPPMLLVGCSGQSYPATAWLDHSWPAALGGTMAFRLTINPRYDLPHPRDTTTTAAGVYFFLQDGLTAVEPLDPAWSVTRKVGLGLYYDRPAMFKAGISQTFEMQVRLDQEGDLSIAGAANMVINGEKLAASNFDSLYLRITPTGTQIQRTPFKA